jgi:hypothetical protein
MMEMANSEIDAYAPTIIRIVKYQISANISVSTEIKRVALKD